MAEWKHISEEFVAKFIQSSKQQETEKPNLDHSSTVITAVQYGKTERLSNSLQELRPSS